MTPSRSHPLNVTVEFDGSLLVESRLDALQSLLRDLVPQWSEGLHIWRSREARIPVDVTASGALAEAMISAVTTHGPLYGELEQRYGKPSAARVCGSAELRGANGSLILVLTIDEEVFSRAGDTWLLGNTVSCQLLKPRIDGMSASMWAMCALEALARCLPTVWGHAELHDEYYAKNMETRDGLRAIGVDISAAIPGLYWLNFLGSPYMSLIGRNRLLSAPADKVIEVDDGVILAMHEDPVAWDTQEYLDVQEGVLDHLGRQFFFSRQHPERETVAPDFGLPKLAPDQPITPIVHLPDGTKLRLRGSATP